MCFNKVSMFDTHANLAASLIVTVPQDALNGILFNVSAGDGELFAPSMPVTLCPPGVMPTFDNAEIGYISEVVGDRLTILRRQEDSTGKAIEPGWVIAATVTKKSLTDIEAALASVSAELDSAAGKLAGIAPGATQNATDAALRDRSTHTGSQPISTIAGLQTALDGKQPVGDYATNTALTNGLAGKANASSLATVATSGAYIDLTGRPTIPVTIVEGVTAGANVTIDSSDPSNPVISATAGAAGVSSVNAETGAVILDTDDIAEGANKYVSQVEKSKLAGIAPGATANSSDATLLNRANHTGTQAQSTITDLTTDMGLKMNRRVIATTSTPLTAGAAAQTDYVYRVSGATTLTLPTAVGNTNRYTVVNVGSSTVTVATTSSQMINGSSFAAMPIADMSLDLISDGSNWTIT